MDRGRGIFVDPNKVHHLNYQGRWFTSMAPLTVPRLPQGRPVIIQAGQSERGREFAARWRELLFVIFHDLENCRAFYDDIRQAGCR